MKTWTRRVDMTSHFAGTQTELWEQHQDGKIIVSFPVAVSLGKPLDVIGLKNNSLNEILEYSNFLQKTAKKLYASRESFDEILNCPICEASVRRIAEIRIFDIAYLRCDQCGHVFVGKQPKVTDLNQQFEDSAEHSSTYVDVNTIEVRLKQVIAPKVEWVRNVFQNRHGYGLKSGLDVGAGGGHFVEGLRRSGVKAEGIELSRASRNFAKTAFGINLRTSDFLASETNGETFDVVTFWGLLEYTPQPKYFLREARKWLTKDGGMLVVEVPRFDSLSTEIQRQFPETVARHLDPTSHVNCFSDASLITALYETGFQPVAAWYFGMDFYETLIQISVNTKRDLLSELANIISPIQLGLDRARFCDDLIVAAVPI